MMKKIFPLMAAAAMMLLTACYHDQHEEMPSEYGDQPVGYLTPLLLWDDPADVGTTTTIDDIRFTVSGTGGTTVANRFNNTEASADWLQQLPVGEYDLLVTADMDEAHGYVLENAGTDTRSTTRADEEFHTALPDTRVSLSQPSSSPAQAWYAVTHATVKPDEVTVAEFHLQRLLSELSVIVHNVPTGATISASVERVAHDVLLTHRDGQGRYGVADREDFLTVSLGALAADPGRCCYPAPRRPHADAHRRRTGALLPDAQRHHPRGYTPHLSGRRAPHGVRQDIRRGARLHEAPPLHAALGLHHQRLDGGLGH